MTDHEDCTCCRQWRKVETISRIEHDELVLSGKLVRIRPPQLPPFENIPSERAIVRAS